MAWLQVGQDGRSGTPEIWIGPPWTQALKPGIKHASFETGPPTAAIFSIEDARAPRVKLPRTRGIPTYLWVLNEYDRQAKPTTWVYKLDDDAGVYAVQMIEYKAPTELYMFSKEFYKNEKMASPRLPTFQMKRTMKYQAMSSSPSTRGKTK